MSAERASELGHRAWQLQMATLRQLDRLRTTSPTFEQVLTGAVSSGLDFAALDEVASEITAFIAEAGDQTFTMEGAQHSLAAWLDQIGDVRRATAPYRVNGNGKRK